MFGRRIVLFWSLLLAAVMLSCAAPPPDDSADGAMTPPSGSESGGASAETNVPAADFTLGIEDTHNKFSRTIEPRLRVPGGAVVELHTKEASDGQFNVDSMDEDVSNLDFEPIHPLTGPIFVEGAMPGDVLRVELHDIEVGDWGWTAITPGFSSTLR